MSPKEKQATAKLAFAFSGRINEQISKKVHSQRFALQELLKQFLEVYRYCTSIFLFHKKEKRIIYLYVIIALYFKYALKIF